MASSADHLRWGLIASAMIVVGYHAHCTPIVAGDRFTYGKTVLGILPTVCMDMVTIIVLNVQIATYYTTYSYSLCLKLWQGR